MDWLEEKWENCKRYIQNASLAGSVFCYAFMAVAIVLVCSRLTRNICYSWMSVLQREEAAYWIHDGSLGTTGLFWGGGWILAGIYNYCTYVYLVLGIFLMARLFVSQRVSVATAALSETLHAMAMGDLSHEIHYQGKDEIGKLCADCEALRDRLIQEKQGLWALQEGQRKVNSAFAHDIRTPLTVVKGYTEFLLKYVPQGKVTEKMLTDQLKAMLYQENRLLEFTKTMSTIQEIERRQLHCSWRKPKELLRQMEVLARLWEGEIQIRVDADELGSGEMLLDLDAVLEAFENVLNNSLRFARKEVVVTLRRKEKFFYIYVKDDGPGFSRRALQDGAQFYYSENKGDGTHFGMGLSVGSMLMEKHGGGLTLANSVDGGAIVAMELFIGSRP